MEEYTCVRSGYCFHYRLGNRIFATKHMIYKLLTNSSNILFNRFHFDKFMTSPTNMIAVFVPAISKNNGFRHGQAGRVTLVEENV